MKETPALCETLKLMKMSVSVQYSEKDKYCPYAHIRVLSLIYPSSVLKFSENTFEKNPHLHMRVMYSLTASSTSHFNRPTHVEKYLIHLLLPSIARQPIVSFRCYLQKFYKNEPLAVSHDI